MKKSLMTLFFILLITQLLTAQSRRIVLLEEATSATCPPCAAQNPGLQKFLSEHLGGIISVRYHAWWPGTTDPMYQLNTMDNRNRIGYYSINSVPTYVLDGHKYGGPSNPDLIRSQMLERLQHEAPAEIFISTERGYDSLRTSIEVVPQFDPGVSNLVLRAAIIERLVTYVSAPGTNGEKQFGDVMRKMLPDGNGIALNSFTPGDTMLFSFVQAVNSAWVPEDLSVVAWLQNNDSKEILQANIDFPTSIIESAGSGLDLLRPDTTALPEFKIVNHNRETLDLEISFSRVKKDAGWSYTLIGPDGPVDNLSTQITPGDSLLFSVQVNSGTVGALELDLFAKNLNDPGFYGEGYGFGYTYHYQAVVPYNRDVLLVDADGGADYELGFQNVFDAHNIPYLTMDPSATAELAKQMDLNDFKLIIWNVSWSTPVLSENEVNMLEAYLDKGGNLLALGQDLGWDIFDDQGSSNFTAAKDFYHQYLGAQYISDNSDGTSIVGVADDPIGDSLSFSLERPYGISNFYPEELGSFENKAQPMFLYNNGKTGGVHYDAGKFRTVYTGFGLEQINGDDNREKFLMRTLEWTGALTDLEPSPANLPRNTDLMQNYPNPFNPKTQIRYSLAASGFVELDVFTVLGNKVCTLVKKKQEAGNYSVLIDGSGWASGIYFYRLRAGKVTSPIRKMMLLK